jgi:putative Holliday junction resolvase
MILGVDPGERRIGVAVADDETRFARALEVIDSRETDPIVRIGTLVRDLGVRMVVVGRPTSLSGAAGHAVDAQRGFVDELRAALAVPVEDYDERLTTVMAERSMRAAGAKRGARKAMRDAVAAAVMLQGYLDSESR